MKKYLLLKSNICFPEVLGSNHGKLPGEARMSAETPENHFCRVQKRQRLLEKIKAIGELYQLVYN